MGSRNLSFIFAATVLCLLLHFPSQTDAIGTGSLSKICKKSPNHATCVRILSSQPNILSASSVKQVAKIALGMVRKNSTETSDFINGVKADNPYAKSAPDTCAKYFKEANQFLNLKGLQRGTARLDVNYAFDKVDACVNVLSTANAHISSVSDETQKWKDVFLAAYAAVVAIEK